MSTSKSTTKTTKRIGGKNKNEKFIQITNTQDDSDEDFFPDESDSESESKAEVKREIKSKSSKKVSNAKKVTKKADKPVKFTLATTKVDIIDKKQNNVEKIVTKKSRSIVKKSKNREQNKEENDSESESESESEREYREQEEDNDSISMEEDIIWVKNLIKFISNLNPIRLLKDQGFESLYDFMTTDDKAIAIWIKGFTHLSYNPENNYEMLSYFGDRVLKIIFADYLIERYPDFNQGNFTNLEIIYMASKGTDKGRIVFSKSLHLNKYIRIRDFASKYVGNKVIGDVFTSFFGCVRMIGDLYRPMSGILVAKRVFANVMQDFPIDFDKQLKGTIKKQHKITTNSTNIDWIKNLMSFIGNIKAISLLKNQGFEPFYNFMTTDEKAIAIWIKGFTDSSYDNDTKNNYEILEYFGDKLLKIIFNDYIIERFPHLNTTDLTNIETTYMSAKGAVKGQIEYTKALGLDKYIRTNHLVFTESDNKTLGDIFESFFGCIRAIGDLYRPMFGILIAKKILVNMMEYLPPINIESSRLKVPSQVVRNIFSRLYYYNTSNSKFYRLNFPTEKQGFPYKSPDDDYYVISLDKNQLDFLKKYDKHLPKILAKQRITEPMKENKKEDHRKLFAAANEKLKEYGIDEEWSIKIAKKLDFERPDIKKDINKALERRNKEGYIDWEFQVLENIDNELKDDGLVVMQLIGIKNNGREQILKEELVKSDKKGGNYMYSKGLILKDYANYK